MRERRRANYEIDPSPKRLMKKPMPERGGCQMIQKYRPVTPTSPTLRLTKGAFIFVKRINFMAVCIKTVIFMQLADRRSGVGGGGFMSASSGRRNRGNDISHFSFQTS